MAAMHDQMMESMQADLDTMRTNLQEVKDHINKVSDFSMKDMFMKASFRFSSPEDGVVTASLRLTRFLFPDQS